MNKTFLTAVSALAIMVASPAIAETKTSGPDHTKSTGSFSEDAKKAWDNTKKDVSEAAENISDAVEETYGDVKEAMADNDDQTSVEKIVFDPNQTATVIIGQPVYNVNGDRVAKVRDIILDQNGNAKMVVLGDGDFTGLGKLVAFDYSLITSRSQEGDIITSLTEETIDKAANFSYDPAEAGENVRVIPSNGYSAYEMLKGHVVDPNGKELANVDNFIFHNGEADKIVVSFGTVLGLGGEQAALAFGDTDVMKKGKSVEFKLSTNEAMQFEQYKKNLQN